MKLRHILTKLRLLVALAASVLCLLAGLLSLGLSISDPIRWLTYQRIRPGMRLSQVEALLGPGKQVPENAVPRVPPYVKPMRNGECAPVIDGDTFFFWEKDATEIWISVRDGEVCDKWWWEPSL